MARRGLLSIVVCFAFASCGTLGAVRHPPTNEDRRAALRYISEQATHCDGVEVSDGTSVNRSRPIFRKLVDAADLAQSRISLHVIDCPGVVNALSVNATAVGVFTVLVDRTNNDDELAFVIGHELAHIALGHTNEDQRDSVAALLGGIGFDADDETAADEFAVTLLTRAGFNAARGALLREKSVNSDATLASQSSGAM